MFVDMFQSMNVASDTGIRDHEMYEMLCFFTCNSVSQAFFRE